MMFKKYLCNTYVTIRGFFRRLNPNILKGTGVLFLAGIIVCVCLLPVPQKAASSSNYLDEESMDSRDAGAINMYVQDGVEYMELNGGIYRDMESFGEIYAGERARCTIQASGEARWYVVGEDAAGKTMTVTLPEDGGFYVYDSALQLVAASHTYGDTQAVLPEDGVVVFAGDVGAQFSITME